VLPAVKQEDVEDLDVRKLRGSESSDEMRDKLGLNRRESDAANGEKSMEVRGVETIEEFFRPEF